MLLMNLVETSRRVTETSRRLEKIDLLAGLLRQARTEEIEPAVAFLSGRATQGRIGIGYAALREAAGGGAEQATLELAEVDGMLGSLARVSGRGSEARRRELLGTLFARATPAEQSFLTGLLLGEIRQGALEGVMVEALAKAFEVSPERMRRAVMMTGDAARVAKLVVERGACALDECGIQLFRPVQPMLAQTAEDVD
jgi:DNA ligase-1